MALSPHNSTSKIPKRNQSKGAKKTPSADSQKKRKVQVNQSKTTPPPEPPTPPNSNGANPGSNTDSSEALPERSDAFKQALENLPDPERKFLLTTENSLKKSQKEGKLTGMLKRLYKNPAKFMKWYSEHT